MQCGERFCLSQPSPTPAVGCVQAPLAFEHPLRPGIIVTVCNINDTNRRTGANCSLQKNAARERFIVRMRCEQQQARTRSESWNVHGKSSSRSAAKRNAGTPIILAATGSISRGENSDLRPAPKEQPVVFSMMFAQKCVRPAAKSAHHHMASHPACPLPGHRVQRFCKTLESQLRI